MGCRDQTSNFQYTHYRPEDGKWWCSTGYEQVYAVPKGYENELAKYLSTSIRWRVTFNAKNQHWEARPIFKD